jgi:hypothetical protein
MARLAAIQERQDRMAQLAEQGPTNAVARLKRDRYLVRHPLSLFEGSTCR